jgi:hypothetical protein
MDHQAIAQLLGNYGEFVGAIAVVVTLAYLAVQVRQSKEATEANTRQMRGQAFVELNTVSNRFYMWHRDNPDQLDVILRGTQDWQSLSSAEQRLAMLYFADETHYYELAYMLFHEKALDEQSYTSREEYFLSLLRSPGRRFWWDNFVDYIDGRFKDRINDQLEIAEKSGVKSLGERFPMYAPGGDSVSGK